MSPSTILCPLDNPIADVMTGKLDVREAVERIPSPDAEEDQEDEVPDRCPADPEEEVSLHDDPELLPISAEEE